jgi:hypothetical protein
MKPLFVPIFSLLTIVVLTVVATAHLHAASPVRYSTVPMHEVLTIYEMPSYSMSNSIVTTMSDVVYADRVYVDERTAIPVAYTAAKPTEAPITLPRPLAPLAPIFPVQTPPQTEAEVMQAISAPTMPIHTTPAPTVRGQARTVDDLGEYLDAPLPIARGSIEAGIIESKLIGSLDSSESETDIFATTPGLSTTQTGSAAQKTTSTDPLGDAVLLTMMIIVTLVLIYMAFVAYDYHQRLVHSLTTQNNRYLGGGAFDVEMEDLYSNNNPVSFSENFGLSRHSI